MLLLLTFKLAEWDQADTFWLTHKNESDVRNAVPCRSDIKANGMFTFLPSGMLQQHLASSAQRPPAFPHDAPGAETRQQSSVGGHTMKRIIGTRGNSFPTLQRTAETSKNNNSDRFGRERFIRDGDQSSKLRNILAGSLKPERVKSEFLPGNNFSRRADVTCDSPDIINF